MVKASHSETESFAEIEPSKGLASSAGLLAIGNAASRLLGLVREMVIAYYFGASGQVSAFRVASQVPSLLYDFLIGGMLSAALVPVLSEYVRIRKRTEFVHLVGALIGVFSIVLAGLVLVLVWIAPTLAWLLAGGLDAFDPTLLPLTTNMIRLLAPALWLFSMAGLLTAVLYALQRFTFPAIATATYNLGIVVAAPYLADRIGIYSLAIGILIGSSTQLLLMLWDLHLARVGVRPRIDWRHPALRRILRLYAPIAASLVVGMFQIGLDRRLASTTGVQSIAWMANATTLQQMPLGLISVAIALAALPRLSQYYAAGDEKSYRHTLGRGLRMVLVLIVPAACILWLAGEPLVRLLFERGDFSADDTAQVARALNVYLIGMLFAAVDFPLNYAFYARHNTLLPAVIGVVSVGVYTLVAFTLLDSLGYMGLVWADTAKHGSHALIMVILLYRRIGPLGANLGRGLALIMIGAGAMSATMFWVWHGLFTPSTAFFPSVRQITVGGIAGLSVYVIVLWVLGLPEIREIGSRLARRFQAMRR